MIEEYKEEHLPALLPLYYNRLFPSDLIYQWLSYGLPFHFATRELSFTLIGDIYKRYQSFETHKDFVKALCREFPVKIDIGARYVTRPIERVYGEILNPLDKELVFDIDMTDYDSVRTCCSNVDVCSKCWKFMAIASKIVDASLREDFGFKHILWVFSGRRGIHCWVSDDIARCLDDSARSAVADYLNIFSQSKGAKSVFLKRNAIHTSIGRGLSIIEKSFHDMMINDQDFLGTTDRLDKFLQLIDTEHQKCFKDAMIKVEGSESRWCTFEMVLTQLQHEHKMAPNLRHLKEEIMLQYAYARLDIHVTKGLTHLLKSPFCVHPKTGKVCIPFNVKHVDSFDPDNVPTISTVMAQVDLYDQKTKEQVTNTDELDDVKKIKIKDFKKTSLLKPVTLFMEFLRNQS